MSTYHPHFVHRCAWFAAASVLLVMLHASTSAQSAALTTDHGNYLPGETIVATFHGGPGQLKDWVGIYPEGTVPGSVASTVWRYTDGTQTGTTGLTEGAVTFPDGLSLAGD